MHRSLAWRISYGVKGLQFSGMLEVKNISPIKLFDNLKDNVKTSQIEKVMGDASCGLHYNSSLKRMWVHLTFNQVVAGSIPTRPTNKLITCILIAFRSLCGQTCRLVPFVPKDILLGDRAVHAPHDVFFRIKEWQIHDLTGKHVSIG